ncbi:thioredoxin [Trypanosoma grayi]|uniref:thioredoxin n=1 Tax=Trypanosoma grayi TaxID=71804 RepID=UPI0004F443C6|nr:thioredoxin [Trypanosoma grayi]KEG13816.1 thioredoxin [Trypanosoma grayi]
MRNAFGYLSRCLAPRRSVACVVAAQSRSQPMGAAALLSVQCPITSFKGGTQDFIDEVSGEKAVLVYFYTPWCKPCHRVTASLEALEADGHISRRMDAPAPKASATPAAPEVEVKAGAKAGFSCSSAGCPLPQTTKTKASQSSATSAPEPYADPEVALKSASEVCLLAQGDGTTVRIIPIDTDENPKLGALHDIRSVPTFVTYRDGRIVGRAEGFRDGQLRRLVSELLRDDGNQPGAGNSPVQRSKGA